MIGVLIGSRKAGCSAKVAVRKATYVCVEGMRDDDMLRVTYHGPEIINDVIGNGNILIPADTLFVTVAHSKASGSNVFVDLR